MGDGDGDAGGGFDAMVAVANGNGEWCAPMVIFLRLSFFCSHLRSKQGGVPLPRTMQPTGEAGEEMAIPRPRRPPLTGRLRHMLWACVLLGAPVILGQLIVAMAASRTLPAPSLEFMEYFAGAKALTMEMRAAGFNVGTFEYEDDPVRQNFNTDIGYVTAVEQLMSVKGGGGMLAAIVCSTWVPLNAGTSKRTPDNPLGRQELPSVAMGNLMAARAALLLQLATVLGLLWIVEQPLRSLLFEHPRMKGLYNMMQITRTHTLMWRFGARSKKPTWLWSNRDWLHEIENWALPLLRRRSIHPLAPSIKDKKGQPRFSGGKKTKESQAYTRGFGCAVANVFSAHQHELKAQWEIFQARVESQAQRGDEDKLWTMMTTALPPDRIGWADAKLAGVFAYLRGS